MSGPQVAIDLGRIERNARTIVERCKLAGIKVFGVGANCDVGLEVLARKRVGQFTADLKMTELFPVSE